MGIFPSSFWQLSTQPFFHNVRKKSVKSIKSHEKRKTTHFQQFWKVDVDLQCFTSQLFHCCAMFKNLFKIRNELFGQRQAEIRFFVMCWFTKHLCDQEPHHIFFCVTFIERVILNKNRFPKNCQKEKLT